ncbi:MAG: YceI family protein [Pseudomonadota bacterium]|nr:YceI family protein [Pseudomonadota bacterium]
MTKFSSLILSAALLAVSNSAISAPVNYAIDTKGMHASINFKVNHLGYSWLSGRFNQFSGEYQYDPDNLANSKITVNIETKSVSTNHAERDKHLRSADFLNVSKHPESSFVSTAISGTDDNMQVKGNFTLNGVTKPIIIQASKVGEGKDPWGGYRSGFMGTTEIKMADYNITKDLGPASANVLLELHIEGTKK